MHTVEINEWVDQLVIMTSLVCNQTYTKYAQSEKELLFIYKNDSPNAAPIHT